jgi:hypothetical protein
MRKKVLSSRPGDDLESRGTCTWSRSIARRPADQPCPLAVRVAGGAATDLPGWRLDLVLDDRLGGHVAARCSTIPNFAEATTDDNARAL